MKIEKYKMENGNSPLMIYLTLRPRYSSLVTKDGRGEPIWPPRAPEKGTQYEMIFH